MSRVASSASWGTVSKGKWHGVVQRSYLQPLDGCFMGFEIIFVFLVVSSQNVGIHSHDLPWQFNGNFLRLGSKFVCRGITQSEWRNTGELGKDVPSAPSSGISTSTPAPASAPLSLACFRTSFQDRYVRRRLTLALSCRIRKIRSSAER